jgi:hypothetical protein
MMMMSGLLQSFGSSRKRLRRGTRAFRREVDAGAARVFVDHGFQWDGSRNVWLTRARARFVLGAGPRFRLRPRWLFERLLGWPRGRPSGDPCIDDFFVALTEDPGSTWAALTLRARSLLARAFDDAELISDGNTVTLWREGDFGRESDAAAAIELVGEVVEFRFEIFERLRRLPGAVYRRSTGDWDEREPPSILLHVPAPVVLAPVRRRGGATLAARSPCGSDAVRLTIDFDDPDSVADGASRLGTRLATAARLAPRRLVCDGANVELIWPDLDVDRERILAGARWVAELAGCGHRAAYR